MIRVENVSKSFGSKKALHQISFEIKEGEIFGFLGPSGSGKTTMINVLTGQLTADQGNTILLGKNSQDLTSNDLEQIGIVSDGSGFYEKMSLYKNLLIYAKLYGLKSDRVNQVLQQVGLAQPLHAYCDTLSGGERQRLCLARVLLMDAQTYLLDEPSAALDTQTERFIIKSLDHFVQSRGKHLVMVTHSQQIAALYPDACIHIENGRIGGTAHA